MIAQRWFKMQQPEQQTVSWRGRFHKVLPQPSSLPGIVHLCLLYSNLSYCFVFTSLLFSCRATPSIWHVFINTFVYLLFPLFSFILLSLLSAAVILHPLSSSPLLRTNPPPFFPRVRRYWSVWKEATKMSAHNTSSALSGSASAFKFTFTSKKSLCAFVAICLSVYLLHRGTWL